MDEIINLMVGEKNPDQADTSGGQEEHNSNNSTMHFTDGTTVLVESIDI